MLTLRNNKKADLALCIFCYVLSLHAKFLKNTIKHIALRTAAPTIVLKTTLVVYFKTVERICCIFNLTFDYLSTRRHYRTNEAKTVKKYKQRENVTKFQTSSIEQQSSELANLIFSHTFFWEPKMYCAIPRRLTKLDFRFRSSDNKSSTARRPAVRRALR